MILPKNLMTEEDIKLQYITPAITAKWSQSKITMETKITDGRIKPPPHNSANMRICKSKAVFTAYHLIHTAEWVY